MIGQQMKDMKAAAKNMTEPGHPFILFMKNVIKPFLKNFNTWKLTSVAPEFIIKKTIKVCITDVPNFINMVAAPTAGEEFTARNDYLLKKLLTPEMN